MAMRCIMQIIFYIYFFLLFWVEEKEENAGKKVIIFNYSIRLCSTDSTITTFLYCNAPIELQSIYFRRNFSLFNFELWLLPTANHKMWKAGVYLD